MLETIIATLFLCLLLIVAVRSDRQNVVIIKRREPWGFREEEEE